MGNPNTGKSSLFNQLSGLRQRVGNFPGVTVDKKEAEIELPSGREVRLVDLPGLYSLVARSPDEQVVTRVLLDPAHELHPDAVIMVADVSNLRRNLFLFSQVADLGLPIVVALTMDDVARGFGVVTSADALAAQLGVPVVAINPRTGQGLEQLLLAVEKARAIDVEDRIFSDGPFNRFVLDAEGATPEHRKRMAADTTARYKQLDTQVARAQRRVKSPQESLTERLDRVLLHPVWGYAIFLAILFVIFQAVFTVAAYPMDWIDSGVAALGHWLQQTLPQGWFSRLISEGLIPGLGGIVIFIPQIAILFAFIAVLEDTGYMARVIFITDKIMRRFGLSGRSVVPLFSGLACAVPAIMAARTIENRRERLLTILVTPFMSCSARIPVFTTLTALAVPERLVLGFFSLQGLIMMGMYLAGTVFAIGSAWVLKHFITARGRTVFMLELPWFKTPRWQNVAIEAYQKSRTFVVDAGKVILFISLVLWFMAAYGPGNRDQRVAADLARLEQTRPLPESERDNLRATLELEHSYAGLLGHAIEPVIRPLGFDWRIGIALLASFAAREVFVGTMATIHSVGQNFEDDNTLLARMRQSRDAETGLPTYRPAVAFSLMVFYLLAMQCMSTFSIVRRELNSWPWAIGQTVAMTVLAWLCSWAVYNLFS